MSSPVRGNCPASRPMHNPPCRVEQRRRGRRTRSKCRKRCREVWRQMWVKQGAVRYVGDGMTFKTRKNYNPTILSRAGVLNLSHVQKNCVCGVLLKCTEEEANTADSVDHRPPAPAARTTSLARVSSAANTGPPSCGANSTSTSLPCAPFSSCRAVQAVCDDVRKMDVHFSHLDVRRDVPSCFATLSLCHWVQQKTR